MNPESRLARVSFTAGPAAFLGGWLLMLPLDGDLVPGPWWTAAHAVWLTGFLFFGVITLALRRMAAPVTGGQRVLVEIASGVALVSVAANVAQLAIDLAVGFASVDGAAMRALFDQVRAIRVWRRWSTGPARSCSSPRYRCWPSPWPRCAGSPR